MVHTQPVKQAPVGWHRLGQVADQKSIARCRLADFQLSSPAQGCYYVSGNRHWRWLYAVAEAVPLPPAPLSDRSQQK
jgi:hypothetical protein